MADTNITMTTAGGVRLKTEGNYVDTDIVVAPDSTSQANLIPENIRSGVSILDVDGTLNPQDGLSMYTTTATLVTTGTGTIAATAINLPTGRTLQVDDLLVDTAGTVVRVTAVGTNVSYTYYASYRGPAGQGVPTGGTTGQVLKKASNTNYDTEWVDESGGIQSNTASQAAFSTVSNIVTTTQDSPDVSALPENTLLIKIAS